MILLLSLACGSNEPAAPPPSRFDAVMATPKDTKADAAEFCEGGSTDGPGTPFAWPALDGEPPAQVGAWTWVNVWATWCAPCVEEMPRLQAWEPRLAAEVGPGAVRFLSVDDQADKLTAFAAAHPGQRTGVRIAEFKDLPGWLPGIGLDAGAVLPIHVFLDAQQRVRCVREGAVGAQDYDTVKHVLGSLAG